MDLGIAGRRAILLGSSRGLGRACAESVAREGVELVLHGHSHRSHLGWVDTPQASAPAIGVRSASAIGLQPGKRAQYHIYRLEVGTEKRALDVEVREYSADRHRFEPVDRWSLELPARVHRHEHADPVQSRI